MVAIHHKTKQIATIQDKRKNKYKTNTKSKAVSSIQIY